VFIADLTRRSGSEQAGRRPVIIVSHNGFNETPNWRSIIVIPISTSINQARRSLTAIPLFEGEGGIRENSVALCHQITTIDKNNP
jgi:mRNA interferase MazF